MFGLTLIKTAKLRSMQLQIEEKDKTIDLHSETIGELRKEVARLQRKKDAKGRFMSNKPSGTDGREKGKC